MRQRLTVLLVFGLMICACASREPGSPIKPGFNVFSREEEIQIGQQAAAEVRQQLDVVRSEPLQNYVGTIGRRLARDPAAAGFPYSFEFVNDRSINAFALPGGPVFAHTGLVMNADNEAQFAGVLAHEISHVALRHGTSQASRANMIQLPLAIAGAVIGQSSVPAQIGQVGIGVGAQVLLLKYSRTAESEADALGARLMANSGYNPIEMARFFEKLEAEGGSRAPDFLSSHPSPGNRVQNVEAEIRTLPASSYAEGTGRLTRMKALVSQLPPPRKRS